jgi:hypothetical protein
VRRSEELRTKSPPDPGGEEPSSLATSGNAPCLVGACASECLLESTHGLFAFHESVLISVRLLKALRTKSVALALPEERARAAAEERLRVAVDEAPRELPTDGSTWEDLQWDEVPREDLPTVGSTSGSFDKTLTWMPIVTIFEFQLPLTRAISGFLQNHYFVLYER